MTATTTEPDSGTDGGQPSSGEPRRRWPLFLVVGLVAVAVIAAVIGFLASSDDGGTDGGGGVAVPEAGNAGVVSIPAGSAVQSLVDAQPVGTTFRLEAGEYRGQTIVPRDGDVFEGAGAATVLNGAHVLSGWEQNGRGWSVGGQSQGGTATGECRPESPRCGHAEELFVDGTRLAHVDSLAAVDAGSWYFDYDADRIHIGIDPSGHTIETSLTPFAFQGTATGVVLRDLVVTHYASPSQRGAIQVEGTDWTLEGVSAVDNHALGIWFRGDRTVIRDSTVSGNGQLGIGGSEADGARLQRVDITDNNTIGYYDPWEGGGAKFTATSDLEISDSNVQGNDGAGIWFDMAATGSNISRNTVTDNEGAGIFYEISEKGTITANTVRGNGFGPASTYWLWGAGIQIAASRDVTVSGNTVEDNFNGVTVVQQDRGTGPWGEYLAQDVTITGNTVDPGNGLIGAATDTGDQALFDRGISFRENIYLVDPPTKAFAWANAKLDQAGWTDRGMS